MSLIGRHIQQSTHIQNQIEDLVQQVTEMNSRITGIRGPLSSEEAQAKSEMDAIAGYRGRPLNYAYIGSGAGRGPYVELEDGSVKMDLINGIGIHLMGHSHPRVMKAALRGALSDVIMQGNLQPNIEYVEFSKKLVEIASKKSRLRHVWFSTCGTMANENALKMARQKNSPAKMVVAFKNAFAGRSTMMAEVTDNPAYKQGLPEYNEILRIPFFDKKNPQSGQAALLALTDHIARHEKQIAVFCFEPMLGEGGYQAAPRDFFIPLLETCKKHGIAIWADEVQTFARTGEFFAFETLQIGEYIDLCTVAKTVQLGATFYTNEYNPKPGLVAGTFSGATVSMTAGMEMIQMLQEGYFGPEGRIQKIHRRFVEGFNRLNESSCKGKASDAGGLGLMIAFTPFEGKKEQVDALLKKLFQKGIVAFSCGKDPMRVRMLVPAIIQDSEIDEALSIFESCLIEGV
jgi:4-aminobutyrate aminotransferase-like enzyme